jgi:hypothetical protein
MKFRYRLDPSQGNQTRLRSLAVTLTVLAALWWTYLCWLADRLIWLW